MIGSSGCRREEAVRGPVSLLGRYSTRSVLPWPDSQGARGVISRLGNRRGSSSVLAVTSLTKTLIEEIKTAPESVQREVYDFLAFLKARERGEGREDLLPLAESAWASDWNTPEEDAAWRDL